jgi:N-acetylmuramoyl-L-alanine amidase
VELVKRSDWGAARARRGRERLDPARAFGVALHYSGMNSDERSHHRNCAGRVRAMQRFHMEENGWLDVAYNHVLCRHGYVFAGRGFGIRSAANGTKQANDRYYAVCFLGDDTAGRADVTPRAYAALDELLRSYDRRISGAMRVRPHSDFVATQCPGDELRAYIARRTWQRRPPPSRKRAPKRRGGSPGSAEPQFG